MRHGATNRNRWAGPLALLLLLPGFTGCAKSKRMAPGTLLSARQTYEQAVREIQSDRLRQAQSLLQRVNYTPEDRIELEPLVRIAIADATYYQGSGVTLIDARSLYQDFVALYGDHPLAPYAQFQAGVCSLNQVSAPSRDQAETHQAIADLHVVERRWPGSRFAEAARQMIRQAEHNLAEHEFMVGRFYLHRKAPSAAIARFRTILDDYPSFDELDKVYYYLSQAQLAMGNDTEARIYLDKLVTDFPNGTFVDQARKELDKVGGRLEGLGPGSD